MKIKRIIEIEDNYEGMSLEEALHELNDCVFPVIDSSSVAFAIEILSALTQSTPYEPKGDLISREALKKDIEKRCGEPFDYIKTIVPALKAIDNAPTVEPEETCMVDKSNFSKEQYKADIDTAYACGYEQGKTERPKGEWLKSDIPESVLAKCSICCFDCGAYTHNFCPNCGADMRGGAEE